uniref:Serpin domain-containing protein n=1 Tax=Anopheles epiroticus TaxID=199890 RepID=A0A182PKP6_9DIPT
MRTGLKCVLLRVIILHSVVCVLRVGTVNGQFYSLSFGTDESYEPPPAQAPVPPSGPAHQHAIHQKVTPLEAMIDKTNHLGFRVLHQHSKGNRNNIAFSPCALASILVALYEGAAGNSAAELHEQLVVPYDKDVLRVGYRDIHRRLRSYFYQKENLLNGLSLSSENITIRPEYESVLKFYGYDLESIPEMRMPTTTTPLPTTTLELETDEATSDATTEMGNATDTLEPSTTSASAPDETTAESTVEVTSTEASATTVDTTEVEPTTNVPSEPAEDTTTDTTEETSEPSTVEGDESATEETGGEKRRRNLRKRGQRLLQRRHPNSPQRRRSVRTKRQPEEIDIISHQRFLQNFLLQDVTTGSPAPPTLLATAGFPAPAIDNAVRKNPFLQQPDAYRLLDDTIEHNFYLTEADIVKVPYKVYNTILKYAYIERLQSTVIELELDSDDYKLLIILPDYEFGLGNVLKLLQIGDNVPSLREVTEHMSPTWVKTIVPKFNLKGNIILTSDLQNLGMNDIFEPSRADFSLMTEDPTIYAKHIEQSINVNIRTHSLQQLKRFTSLYKNPVELAVNYPFLFCILDNELDLALVVGRILNPLNARIH